MPAARRKNPYAERKWRAVDINNPGLEKDFVPFRVWVAVEGWEEHSGARWMRRAIGEVRWDPRTGKFDPDGLSGILVGLGEPGAVGVDRAWWISIRYPDVPWQGRG